MAHSTMRARQDKPLVCVLIDVRVRAVSNVSGLEQTLRLLANKVEWFHLDAPTLKPEPEAPCGFDARIGSRI
jgi:hypothetical protein